MTGRFTKVLLIAIMMASLLAGTACVQDVAPEETVPSESSHSNNVSFADADIVSGDRVSEESPYFDIFAWDMGFLEAEQQLTIEDIAVSADWIAVLGHVTEWGDFYEMPVNSYPVGYAETEKTKIDMATAEYSGFLDEVYMYRESQYELFLFDMNGVLQDRHVVDLGELPKMMEMICFSLSSPEPELLSLRIAGGDSMQVEMFASLFGIARDEDVLSFTWQEDVGYFSDYSGNGGLLGFCEDGKGWIFMVSESYYSERTELYAENLTEGHILFYNGESAAEYRFDGNAFMLDSEIYFSAFRIRTGEHVFIVADSSFDNRSRILEGLSCAYGDSLSFQVVEASGVGVRGEALYYADDSGLYAADPLTGLEKAVFRWKDLPVLLTRSAEMPAMSADVLPDGRILVCSAVYDPKLQISRTQILTLSRAVMNPDAGKIILRVGGTDISWNLPLKMAVMEFNLGSKDYYAEMVEYNQALNCATSQGEILENTAQLISSQGMPDVLVESGYYMQSFYDYAGKGLLADLRRWMDADVDFDPSDYFENLFDAALVNGEQYFLFPSYSLSGILGLSQMAGDDIGWTWDEVSERLEDIYNVYGYFPDMYSLDRAALARSSWASGDGWLKWDGEWRYDNSAMERFVKLLELPVFGGIDSPDTLALYLENGELPFPAVCQLESLSEYCVYRSIAGEAVTLMGYPKDRSTGPTALPNMLAGISAATTYPDEAWRLVRLLLEEELQSQLAVTGIPVRRSAAEASLYPWVNMRTSQKWTSVYEKTLALYPLPSRDAKILVDMLSELSLIAIPDKELEDIFFSGDSFDFESLWWGEDSSEIVLVLEAFARELAASRNARP